MNIKKKPKSKLIPFSERIYLNCPYSQRKECKALGGKWDFGRKKWYFQSKSKNALENTSVSELRRQCRGMTPPPATGMAISGANKETLINWLMVDGKYGAQFKKWMTNY